MSRQADDEGPGFGYCHFHLMKEKFQVVSAGGIPSILIWSTTPNDTVQQRSAGSMAERLTTNQEVPGSTPGWIEEGLTKCRVDLFLVDFGFVWWVQCCGYPPGHVMILSG